MPVSVLMPRERQQTPEKDPLDQILKGLNIASGIYGIKDAYDKSQILQEQQAMTKADKDLARQKEEQGILTKKEFLDAGKTYDLVSPETANSIKMKLQKGPNEYEDIWLSPKKKDKEIDPLTQAIKQQTLQSMQAKASEEKQVPQNVYAAATYAKRLEDANNQMNSLMKDYDPTSIAAGIQGMSLYPERLRSENSKLMEQSQRNFINAILRRESGSAIAPSEFESARSQYFPAGGDTPEVLAQKERNREVAIAGLRAEGSKAMPRLERELSASQNQQKQIPTSDMNITSGSQPTTDIQNAAMKELLRRKGLGAAVGKR